MPQTEGDMRTFVETCNEFIRSNDERVRIANENLKNAESALTALRANTDSEICAMRAKCDSEIARVNNEMVVLQNKLVKLENECDNYKKDSANRDALVNRLTAEKTELQTKLKYFSEKQAASKKEVVHEKKEESISGYNISFKRDLEGIHGATVQLLREVK